ncbi:hypothetical protein DY000_02019058, partial [Brassica cretica]
ETLHNHKQDNTSNVDSYKILEAAGSLLKNWPIVYCVLCLHDTHTLCSALGLGLFSFQVSVYPLAERLLGPVLVTRFVGALMIPIQMSYRFIANLSGLSLSLLLNWASILINVLIKCDRLVDPAKQSCHFHGVKGD